MSDVICSSCFDIEDTTKRFIELPYVCSACEKDAASPSGTYNSGVPCQSALDSVQAEQYCNAVGETDPRVHAMHADVLNPFDDDTKLIDDLRLQLEQANLNIQVQEEIIEDLENQLTDLRLNVCDALFGKV